MENLKPHHRRMRQLVIDTMSKLLEERSFYKITVQDVIERAEIQRSTFYRYFRDKYEVAEAINQQLIQHMMDFFLTAFYDNQKLDSIVIYNYVSTYGKLTQNMADLRIENVDLVRNMQDAFIEKYRIRYQGSSHYEAYLAAHNFVSTIMWYIDSETAQFGPGHAFDPDYALHQEAQLQWISRYYRVSASELSTFLEQHSAK